jgi:hypothetical protein
MYPHLYQTIGSANSKAEDLSEDVTLFVLTVGRSDSFADCLNSLRQQHVKCRLEIIANIYPLHEALQQMLNRCATRFFVEVDEDMALYPEAIQKLYLTLSRSDNAALACGGLWDCFMRTPIHGVKMYRHEFASKFRFENVLGADIVHNLKLQQSGYDILLFPFRDHSDCLGDHGRHQEPKQLFLRLQRLAQKHRRYNNMPWLLNWSQRLWSRFLDRGDVADLYAFLGLTVGFVEEPFLDREADFTRPEPALDRLSQFMSEIPSFCVNEKTSRALGE